MRQEVQHRGSHRFADAVEPDRAPQVVVGEVGADPFPFVRLLPPLRKECLGGFVDEHIGADAMRHVLRVTSSLDSMVVGEPQILGQSKEAYRQAVDCGACGPILGRLFEHAFATAKRVRTETRVAARPVSVARVAVDLAQQIFEELAGKRALLIGAGDMTEAALEALRERGLASVAIANRTPERAEPLAARFGARAHGLSELPRLLADADGALYRAKQEGRNRVVVV